MYQYSLDNSLYLEDWLINNVLLNFFEFMDGIIKGIKELKVNDPSEINIVLNDLILNVISKSIIDERDMDELEQISSWLASVLYPEILRILEID